ncbi:hemerythrin domain-containing protein [Micromonospora chersina]
MTDVQTERDVVDVLMTDHREVEAIFVELESRQGTPEHRRQLADAERTMKELESLDPSEPRFDELLTKLTATIRHHVQDEENDLFPRLRAACAREELVELAGKVEAAKKSAPTRPHPAAPDRPPANKLLAPGTGLVDRMRDALSGRPTSMRELREKS